MSNDTLEFHFDLSRPTARLANTQVPRIAKETGATRVRQAMLLGAVLKATGDAGPVSVPANGRWMGVDFARWARCWGVPITFSPHFPITTLTVMRCACGLLRRKLAPFRRYVGAVFHAMWVAPRIPGAPGFLATELAEAGFDAADFMVLVADAAVKADLMARTEASVARGAFAAPTFFVGDQVCFGQDRLDFVRQARATA
jgi:2-hydroxychromene-2-carboxylate isomerase